MLCILEGARAHGKLLDQVRVLKGIVEKPSQIPFIEREKILPPLPFFTEIVYATSTAVLFQVGKRKIIKVFKNKPKMM